VFNFILRFTGQPARAEDVLQETWLKVVRGAADYQVRAKFTTWLYTIARNLCVDSARKEAYRQTDSLDAPTREGEARTLGDGLPDASASPERVAQQRQLQPLIERALLTLPGEQREVFLLREYSGVTFKEIAEVTGVPENTVKSRMRYALEGLRRSLASFGVEASFAEPDEREVAG
jgi:RNA polymerase sigma-70 factor (ECF subfamily)